MNNVRTNKAIISLLIIFTVIFSSFAISPSVSAFNYPKISLNKSVSGKLEDYFGGISYELNLNSQKKINITYSSTASTDFCIYDSKMNTIYKSHETKSVNKTMTFKKGMYVFGIYNCTYEKGTYKLKLKDSTVYTQKIAFENDNYKLAVGNKTQLKIKKSPNQSTLNNLNYTSSNNRIATVSKNGLVKAVGLGKAEITAKVGKNTSAKCTVVVDRTSLSVFRNLEKSLVSVGGSAENYSSSNTSIARINKNSVKGISQGNTTAIKYFNGEKYTVNIQVTSAAKLKSAAKRKIKSAVLDSSSLIILHTYRGYNQSGKATVVIDYGVKSAGKIVGRKYFICNYNSDFSLNYRYSSKMPKLTKQKEL